MYKFEELDKITGLKYSISTVKDGDQSFKFRSQKEVINNRENFLSKAEIDINNCFSSTIVHGTKIFEVKSKDKGRGMKDWETSPKCDAMITVDKNIFLFIKIADCAPVVLFDSNKRVLGLIHIGWKNVQNKTLEKVLFFCKSRHDVSCKNLQLFIGPYAHPENYIFKDPVQLNDLYWRDYISKSPKNNYKNFYQIDFVGLLKKQAIDAGIKKNNIYDINVDTITNYLFYSHYRSMKKGEVEGRFAVVCGMV